MDTLDSYNVATNKNKFAFCLDVDGVFVREGKVLDGTPRAVLALEKANIPYIFVTNGGGFTEAAKAAKLSHQLGVPVSEDQMLLSHTPYKDLVPLYADQRVLIIGSEGCEQVAKSYGFKHAVSSRQILCEQPSKFHQYGDKLTKEDREKGVSRTSNPTSACEAHCDVFPPCVAAFIIGDPVEWALDIQILTDELRPIIPTSGQSQPHQRIPMYACNADIVLPGAYSEPRYTQGAFVQAFKSVFEIHCQVSLNVTMYGKPFAVQYRIAEHMLVARSKVIQQRQLLQTQEKEQEQEGSKQEEENSKVDDIATGDVKGDNANILSSWSFIGIGDNPLSDIKGANTANKNNNDSESGSGGNIDSIIGIGPKWTSILVKTGVWTGWKQGMDNDRLNPADIVCDDVCDAVKILGIEMPE